MDVTADDGLDRVYLRVESGRASVADSGIRLAVLSVLVSNPAAMLGGRRNPGGDSIARVLLSMGSDAEGLR